MPPPSLPLRVSPPKPAARSAAVSDRLLLGAAFASAARTYWLTVFPTVCRELRPWKSRALAVSDPALRASAIEGLAKRGNMEGAAVFATFAPRARRAWLIRATVAFQAAYTHLDVLAERRSSERSVDTERLHGALIAALQPGRSASGSGGRPRWSSGSRAPRDDGDDYLGALVSACRGALAKLPSYPALASAALDAAESAIAYQVHNAGAHTPAGLARMERWAAAQTPAGTDLRWWEAAAAAGSSLGLFAALAAAAEEKLEPGDIEALSSACFSAIGELHSLLDHLIDVEEDAGSGQLNLLSFYSGPRQVAERMRLSAERARALARKSPFAIRYELVLAAMAGFYLSSSEARTSAARPATAAVLEALGPLARAATMVFEARSALKRLRGRGRAFRALRFVWS